MSRADVGADGKTGYERCKGRRARLAGMEFGEAVLWKRRREEGPLGKLSCMWDGIFLGVKWTTGEIIVEVQEGRVENEDGEEKDIGRAVGPDNAGTCRRRSLEDGRYRG